MLNRALKALLLGAAVLAATPGVAQEKTNLSIATGGTGGVSYPLGGGMASVLSKYRTRHTGVYPAALFDYIGVGLIGITVVLHKLRNVRIKSAAR
jgi:hypothetical protein